MYESIEAFVASAVEAFGLRGPVYQLGLYESGDPRLQTSLRGCFARTSHVQFELSRAAKADRLPFPDQAARTVLCIGALDYAFRANQAGNEIARILKPGGKMLVCAPLAGFVSGPEDLHWRATPRAVEQLLTAASATVVGWQGAETFPHTMYGIGFKRPVGESTVENTRRFLERFQARLDAMAGRRLARLLARWSRRRCRWRRREYYRTQFAVHLCADDSLQHDPLLSGPLKDKTGTRLDFLG
ncbi:MAG: methyltransferase domain-containing protein [Pirellulales bacterium]|nr:methyltransferase domain-containing protein [Pirellulales bacterium]